MLNVKEKPISLAWGKKTKEMLVMAMPEKKIHVPVDIKLDSSNFTRQPIYK